jgi:molybdopterin-binding protein
VTIVKLSARNTLKGTIGEKGRRHDPCQNRRGDAVVTVSITNEAAEELRLAAGQIAYAVIKASNVMVAVD